MVVAAHLAGAVWPGCPTMPLASTSHPGAWSLCWRTGRRPIPDTTPTTPLFPCDGCRGQGLASGQSRRLTARATYEFLQWVVHRLETSAAGRPPLSRKRSSSRRRAHRQHDFAVRLRKIGRNSAAPTRASPSAHVLLPRPHRACCWFVPAAQEAAWAAMRKLIGGRGGAWWFCLYFFASCAAGTARAQIDRGISTLSASTPNSS